VARAVVGKGSPKAAPSVSARGASAPKRSGQGIEPWSCVLSCVDERLGYPYRWGTWLGTPHSSEGGTEGRREGERERVREQQKVKTCN